MKEFLHGKQVTFTEKNIATDSSAMDELQKLGWMTTPVTVVDGHAVVGFDRAKLEETLGES